ncbi:efflux RND transporter periplasmic adaptor subunit [Uliginosibacterium sp. sgz301328]|uniref:HlyD family secretion protein n=1 Tax=Uliginosibacterium sp. sgz301328 TaxID=3243764 RepID=UPI00359D0B13
MSANQDNTNLQAFAAPANRRRRVMLSLLAGVILFAAIGYGSYYYLHGRWFEETDDAYANGNVVQVSPQIAGTVVTIGADDNALVHAGQSLAALDPTDASVALEQAEANLARTVRQVRGLYTNVGSQEADLAARRAALERARADFDRRQGLAATGAIPAEELAHAREALATAQSALAAAEQQLATSHAMIENTGVLTHPEVKAAAAAVRRAYLDYVRTSMVAPVTGYVAQRSVQVGQRVQPGTPLMAVVPLDQVWVDANFKETQLQHMRIGQEVELTSDLYGSDVTFHGKIAGLGVGTGSAFSLLPAQNATGNWIKIVQRVPVRIALDPKELSAHPLRIGLSMRVEVNMHDRRGPMLAQAPVSAPVFTTDVYARQLDEAEARIASVIQANAGGRVAAAPAAKPAARKIEAVQARKISS